MKINFNDPMSLLNPYQRKRETHVLLLENNEDIFIVSPNKRYAYSLTKPLSQNPKSGATIIVTNKEMYKIKTVPTHSINRFLIGYNINLQSKSILIQRNEF